MKKDFKDILGNIGNLEPSKPLSDEEIETLARRKKRREELGRITPLPEILPGGPERLKV